VGGFTLALIAGGVCGVVRLHARGLAAAGLNERSADAVWDGAAHLLTMRCWRLLPYASRTVERNLSTSLFR